MTGYGQILVSLKHRVHQFYTHALPFFPSWKDLFNRVHGFASTIATYGSWKTKVILNPLLAGSNFALFCGRVFFFMRKKIPGLKPETEKELRVHLIKFFSQTLHIEGVPFSRSQSFSFLQNRFIDEFLERTLICIPEHLLSTVTPQQIAELFEGQLEDSLKSLIRNQGGNLLFHSAEQFIKNGLISLVEKIPGDVGQFIADITPFTDTGAKLLFFTKMTRPGIYTLTLYTSSIHGSFRTFDGAQTIRTIYEFSEISKTKLDELKTLLPQIKGEDETQLPMNFEDIKALLVQHFDHQEPKERTVTESASFSLGKQTHSLRLFKQQLTDRLFHGEHEKSEEFLFAFALNELMVEFTHKQETGSCTDFYNLLQKLQSLQSAFLTLHATTRKQSYHLALAELQERMVLSLNRAYKIEMNTSEQAAPPPVIPIAVWPIFNWLFSTFGTHSVLIKKIGQGLERALGQNYTALLEEAKKEYLHSSSMPKEIATSKSYSYYETAFAILLCTTVYLASAQLLAVGVPIFASIATSIAFIINTELVAETGIALLCAKINNLVPEHYRKIFKQVTDELLYAWVPYAIELFYHYAIQDSFKDAIHDLVRYINAASFRIPEKTLSSLPAELAKRVAKRKDLPIPSEASEVTRRLEEARKEFIQEFTAQFERSPVADAAFIPNIHSPLRHLDRGPAEEVHKEIDNPNLYVLWSKIAEHYPQLLPPLSGTQQATFREILSQFSTRHILDKGTGICPSKDEELFEASYSPPQRSSPILESITPTLLSTFSTLTPSFSNFSSFLASLVSTKPPPPPEETLPKPQAPTPTPPQAPAPIVAPIPALPPAPLVEDVALAASFTTLNPVSTFLAPLSKKEKQEFFAAIGSSLEKDKPLSEQLYSTEEAVSIMGVAIPKIWLRAPPTPTPSTFQEIVGEIQSVIAHFPSFDPDCSLPDYLTYLDSLHGASFLITRRCIDALAYCALTPSTTLQVPSISDSRPLGTKSPLSPYQVYVRYILQLRTSFLMDQISQLNFFQDGALHPRYLRDSAENLQRLAVYTRNIMALLATAEPEPLHQYQTVAGKALLKHAFTSPTYDKKAVAHTVLLNPVILRDFLENGLTPHGLTPQWVLKTSDKFVRGLPFDREVFENQLSDFIKDLRHHRLRITLHEHPVFNYVSPPHITNPTLRIAMNSFMAVLEGVIHRDEAHLGLTYLELENLLKALHPSELSPDSKRQKEALTAYLISIQPKIRQTLWIHSEYQTDLDPRSLLVHMMRYTTDPEDLQILVYLNRHGFNKHLMTGSKTSSIPSLPHSPGRIHLYPLPFNDLLLCYRILTQGQSTFRLHLSEPKQIRFNSLQLAELRPDASSTSAEPFTTSPELWSLEDFHTAEEISTEGSGLQLSTQCGKYKFLLHPLLFWISRIHIIGMHAPYQNHLQTHTESISFIQEAIMHDLESSRSLLENLDTAKKILEILSTQLPKFYQPDNSYIQDAYSILNHWIFNIAHMIHKEAVEPWREKILPTASLETFQRASVLRWATVTPESLTPEVLETALIDMTLGMGLLGGHRTLNFQALYERVFYSYFPYLLEKLFSSETFALRAVNLWMMKYRGWHEDQILHYHLDISSFPKIGLIPKRGGPILEVIMDVHDAHPMDDKKSSLRDELKDYTSSFPLNREFIDLLVYRIDRNHYKIYNDNFIIERKAEGSYETYRLIEGQKWIYQRFCGQGGAYHCLVNSHETQQRVKIFDHTLKRELHTVVFSTPTFNPEYIFFRPQAPYLFNLPEESDFPERHLFASFAGKGTVLSWLPANSTDRDDRVIEIASPSSQVMARFAYSKDRGALCCLTAGGMELSKVQNVPEARTLGPYLVLTQGELDYVLYEPLDTTAILLHSGVQSLWHRLGINLTTLITIWPSLKKELSCKPNRADRSESSLRLMPLDKDHKLKPSSFEDLHVCLAKTLLSDPIAFTRFAEQFCQKASLEGVPPSSLNSVLRLMLAQLAKGQPMATIPLFKLALAVACHSKPSSAPSSKGSSYLGCSEETLLAVLGMILYRHYLIYGLDSHSSLSPTDEVLWLSYLFKQCSRITSSQENIDMMSYALKGFFFVFLQSLLEPRLRERIATLENDYPSPDSLPLAGLFSSAVSRYFSMASFRSDSLYIPYVTEGQILFRPRDLSSAQAFATSDLVMGKSKQIIYRALTLLASHHLSKTNNFSSLKPPYQSCISSESLSSLPLTLSTMTPSVIHQHFDRYAYILLWLNPDDKTRKTLEAILSQVKIPKRTEYAPLYILQQLYLKKETYLTKYPRTPGDLPPLNHLDTFYKEEYEAVFHSGYLRELSGTLSDHITRNYHYLRGQLSTSDRCLQTAASVALGLALPASTVTLSALRAVGATASAAVAAAGALFSSSRRRGRENGGRYDYADFLRTEAQFLQTHFKGFFDRYFDTLGCDTTVHISRKPDDSAFSRRITDSLVAYQTTQEERVLYKPKASLNPEAFARDIELFHTQLSEAITALENQILATSRRSGAIVTLDRLFNAMIESDYKTALQKKLNLPPSLIELISLRIVHLMLAKAYLVKLTKVKQALKEKASLDTCGEILAQPKYYLQSCPYGTSVPMAKQERFIIGCLAIEAKMGVELRQLQTEQLRKALVTTGSRNTVIEMIPGSGKTDFGMILDAYFSWERGRIPIAVFASELIESMKTNYATRFKEFTGRNAFLLAVTREETVDSLKKIALYFEKSIDEGDVIITTKEDLQTLDLLYVEMHTLMADPTSSTSDKTRAKALLPFLKKINCLIHESADIKGDECHVLHSPDVVEKFPLGIETHPTSDEIIGQSHVLQELLKLLGTRKLDSLTRVEYERTFKRPLAEALARKTGLDATEYLASMSQEKPEFLRGHAQETYLAICRGTIHALIPHALDEKLEVSYGLSMAKSIPYVIPYDGNNNPDEASIFESSDVTMILSYFYYLKKGLSKTQFETLTRKLSLLTREEMTKDEVPEEYTSPNQFLAKYFAKRIPTYEEACRHDQVILLYVNLCVAPEIKRFDKSIESTPSDFACMPQTATYYSGTIFNASVYPTSFLCRTLETTGETLHTVREAMTKRGGKITFLAEAASDRQVAETFLDKALDNPRCSMIIDCATLFAGSDNETIARLILCIALKKGRDIQGVQFFDPKGALRVVTGEGPSVLDSERPLKESQRISYLGDRFFGVNISQAIGASAAITLGSHNLSTFEQAAWRMRGLASKEQSVDLFIAPKSAKQMREAGLSEDFDGILSYLVTCESKELLPLNFQASIQKLKAHVRSTLMHKMTRLSPSDSLTLFKEFEDLFVHDGEFSPLSLYGEAVHEIEPDTMLDELTFKLITRIVASPLLSVTEKQTLTDTLVTEPRCTYPRYVTHTSGGPSPGLLKSRQRVKETVREEVKTQEKEKEKQRQIVVPSVEPTIHYKGFAMTPWMPDLCLDNLSWMYEPGRAPDPTFATLYVSELHRMPCAKLTDLCTWTQDPAWAYFGQFFTPSMKVSNNVIHFFEPAKLNPGWISWTISKLFKTTLNYPAWKKPASHILFIYSRETGQIQSLGLSETDARLWSEKLSALPHNGAFEFALCNTSLSCVEKTSHHASHLNAYVKTSDFKQTMLRWKLFNFSGEYDLEETLLIRNLILATSLEVSPDLACAYLLKISRTRYTTSAPRSDTPPLLTLARRVFDPVNQTILCLLN